MNVCVVGLGKIGIPLAVQFASKGATVTGYDINPARVDEVNSKQNPIPGERGLEAIPDLVSSNQLRATTDPRDAAGNADVIILIVPVDIDDAHAPDFATLDAAVDAIAPHLQRDALVIVETTVPVGTTRNRVGARTASATGMTPGDDFAIAFSPERVSSGRVLLDLATYPKIVGGIDAKSTERAVAFYRQMLDAEVRAVRDAETAEFTKLIETTYRDVNIALANEFARLADALGVDARQAIDAANSQPYSHIHDPGVGVGGHCIPVYPYFLVEDSPGRIGDAPWRTSEGTALIETARRINDAMADYAAQRLSGTLGTLDGATVVVLGLSYRANVKESRHSSTFGLVDALSSRGATVYVHDPLYTDDEIRAHKLHPPPTWPLPCDALAIQAWHTQYARLDLRTFDGLRAVLDGRGVLDSEKIAGSGFSYVGIGVA